MFGIRCFPSGLPFLSPITVTLPHCAVLEDCDNVTAVLYSSSDGETWERTTLQNKGIPSCEVLEDKVLLRLNSFCIKIICFKKGPSTKALNVACHPFLPPKVGDTFYLRVYVFQLRKGYQVIQSEIRENEKEHGYQSAHPEQEFRLKLTGKDVTLVCRLGHQDVDTKTVMYADIIELSKDITTLTHRFKPDEQKENEVTLTIRQERQKEIKFPFPPITRTHDTPTGQVSTDQLDLLSSQFPHSKYSTFCVKLGMAFYEAQSILAKHSNDYRAALREILESWKTRTGGQKVKLADLLMEVGAGYLILL